MRNSVVVNFLLLLCVYSARAVQYADTIAIRVEGGSNEAERIASTYGLVNLGQIFGDYYHFKINGRTKRSTDPNHHHWHYYLSKDEKVLWFERQKVLKRVKRNAFVEFNDPEWKRMWYLNRGPSLDMNVQRTWREGYTGKDVVVTILDDGIERDHPDLRDNYDALASYDFNSNDNDPQPRYDHLDENKHGTRCAGEVAAAANNSFCSVGIAYGAKIGGIRMLDGQVTDAIEARALSHNPGHVDIYSASWGPDDDGKTVDGPGPLALKAFEEGVKKGRKGKGSIFVWASGNGGKDFDSCSCDGYANSIYTISVSSATEHGNVPWYSEPCASTMATTFSSGASGERQVVTTDLRNRCTQHHTGTSASAPLAAGILALVLQANPELTWRDIQHIIVETANPSWLNLDSKEWTTNGLGRNVSHSFGYGLMDATAMVTLAKNWTTVPPQRKCIIPGPKGAAGPIDIKAYDKIRIEFVSDGCSGGSGGEPQVRFLEHVVVVMTLLSSERGKLSARLISPMGTVSQVLYPRRHDASPKGFQRWPLMSAHFWGEAAIGKWTLEVVNGASQKNTQISYVHLELYGSSEYPRPGKYHARSASSVVQIASASSPEHPSPASGSPSSSSRTASSPQGSLQEARLEFYGTSNSSAQVDSHSHSESPRTRDVLWWIVMLTVVFIH